MREKIAGARRKALDPLPEGIVTGGNVHTRLILSNVSIVGFTANRLGDVIEHLPLKC